MTGWGPEVAAVITGWRPRDLPTDAADFARHVVAAAVPVSAVRARSLLWACAALARFGVGVGLEPTPEVLLHPSVIERFVVTGMAGAPETRRRTVRTNLRFVARRVAPAMSPPEPVGLRRDRAKTPYTPAEIASFLGLADAQPTVGRRHRLGALVCLGAGAGLTGADLRHVRGSHVQARHGGVVVDVTGGRHPRVVPVLARFHNRLRAAAAVAGNGFITGGRSEARHNVTAGLVGAVAGGWDLPRIEVWRLRATWLATCADTLGLPAFFAAAGISHSQHVADVVAQLPRPAEADVVTLLSG
jgi:integrase